jgi:hypothetical protein
MDMSPMQRHPARHEFRTRAVRTGVDDFGPVAEHGFEAVDQAGAVGDVLDELADEHAVEAVRTFIKRAPLVEFACSVCVSKS